MLECGDVEYNLNRKIFVGNVSYRVGSKRLSKFFRKFGEVEYCYIVKDHLKKWSRGIAFVTFSTEESMNKALQATEDELFFDGRQMRVKPAELSNKTSFWQDRHTKFQSDEGSASDDDDEMHTKRKVDPHEADFLAQSTGPSNCYIDLLFDELMIKIFEYLSVKEKVGVERVCWRWKHLVQRTWSTLKILHFQNMFKRFEGLTDKSLNCLLSRCGPYLVRLDLSASPRLLTDFAMDIIGKHCPELSELDISNVKITDRSLKNLVTECKAFKWMRLKSCLYIGDKGLQDLFTDSQHLEYVDLSNLSQITGKSFKCLHSSVRVLVLQECFKIQDHGVQQLCDKTGESLEELYLSNCRCLRDTGITTLCRGLSRLKVLHISGTNIHTSSECYRDLEKLTTLVSEHSVILLSHTLRLEKFVARATQFVTDQAVISLVNHCPRLYHLDLSGCFQITNAICDAFRDGTSVDNEHVTVELYLGGTSVDNIVWSAGLPNLKVSFHNLAIEQLRPDRDIILYRDEDFDSEEEEYNEPRIPVQGT